MRVPLAAIVCLAAVEAVSTARWGRWRPANLDEYAPFFEYARDSGLPRDKRVLAVNGRPLEHPTDWDRAFFAARAGTSVRVKVQGTSQEYPVASPGSRMTVGMWLAAAVLPLKVLFFLLLARWMPRHSHAERAALVLAAGAVLTGIHGLRS